MGFRLVPKSVTLNDLERRNGYYSALFRRQYVVNYLKVVDFLPRNVIKYTN